MVGQEGHGLGALLESRRAQSPHSVGGTEHPVSHDLCRRRGARTAHARREHGARIVEEPATHDYSDDYWTDRSYGALDPEGRLVDHTASATRPEAIVPCPQPDRV